MTKPGDEDFFVPVEDLRRSFDESRWRGFAVHRDFREEMAVPVRDFHDWMV